MLAGASILEVALVCWPSASVRSVIVVAVPARLLPLDLDVDDVVELQ